MNEIVTKKLSKELIYKNTVVLTYQIEYPEIVTTSCISGKNTFNCFYEDQALLLQSYAEEELLEDAKKLYDYNTSHGYPVMVYELILSFTITYDKNCILSLYQDKYLFTGGAHGTTVRNSQNWNLDEGKFFTLKSLYPYDDYFMICLLKQINEQIEQQIKSGTGFYFDNYCQLVLTTFQPTNFYLTYQGIVIFFQQYDIAPYSSGIPTFLVR